MFREALSFAVASVALAAPLPLTAPLTFRLLFASCMVWGMLPDSLSRSKLRWRSGSPCFSHCGPDSFSCVEPHFWVQGSYASIAPGSGLQWLLTTPGVLYQCLKTCWHQPSDLCHDVAFAEDCSSPSASRRLTERRSATRHLCFATIACSSLSWSWLCDAFCASFQRLWSSMWALKQYLLHSATSC